MSVGLALEAVVFLGIVLLNERSRWGIPRLRAARAKIEALYKDEDDAVPTRS